jgi:hypothetical protein
MRDCSESPRGAWGRPGVRTLARSTGAVPCRRSAATPLPPVPGRRLNQPGRSESRPDPRVPPRRRSLAGKLALRPGCVRSGQWPRPTEHQSARLPQLEALSVAIPRAIQGLCLATRLGVRIRIEILGPDEGVSRTVFRTAAVQEIAPIMRHHAPCPLPAGRARSVPDRKTRVCRDILRIPRPRRRHSASVNHLVAL